MGHQSKEQGEQRQRPVYALRAACQRNGDAPAVTSTPRSRLATACGAARRFGGRGFSGAGAGRSEIGTHV